MHRAEVNQDMVSAGGDFLACDTSARKVQVETAGWGQDREGRESCRFHLKRK